MMDQNGMKSFSLTCSLALSILICCSHLICADFELVKLIGEPQPIEITGTLVGHTNSVNALDHYQDPHSGQRRVVTGSQDSTIKIWDYDTRQCLLTLAGHTGGVRDARVMPPDFCPSYDGTVVASGSDDTTIGLWGLNNDKPQWYMPFHGHTQRVNVVIPLMPYILASGSDDTTIKIWDVYGQPGCIKTFNGHTAGVQTLLLAKDKIHLFSAGFDGQIIVWNLQTYARVRTFRGPSDRAIFLKELDNDQLLIWDDGCAVWNWKTGQLIRSFIKYPTDPASQGIFDMGDYDAKHIIFCKYDTTFWVYDYMSGQLKMGLTPKPAQSNGTNRISILKDAIIFSNLSSSDAYIAQKPDAADITPQSVNCCPLF